jgi:hypothetical protein
MMMMILTVWMHVDRSTFVMVSPTILNALVVRRVMSWIVAVQVCMKG